MEALEEQRGALAKRADEHEAALREAREEQRALSASVVMLEKQLREQAALHERALSEAGSAARQHTSHERRSQAQLDQLKAKEIALQRSHSELSAANGKIESLEARVRQFGAEKDDLAARLAKEHENETRELVRLVERAKEERDSVYRRNAGALIAAERLVHDLDKREELLFPQEAAGGGASRSRRGASGVAAPPSGGGAAPQTPPRSAQKEPPQQLTAPPSAGSTIATVRTPAPPTPAGSSPGGKRLHTSLAEFVLAMRNTPLGGASPRAAGSRSDVFVD